jgi:hypothetical protein
VCHCTLQAVLSPVLSSDLSSEAVQTVSNAIWVLFLAAKAEQGADGQAGGLAAQLSTLLGAVAAVAAQLPPQWLTTDGCTAAALAAANGAAALDVSAAAARASRLLAAALAAADPQASRGRAAAAGQKQVSHPGALSAQPDVAAQRMVAAAAWLEARYAERCSGGSSGCSLLCIDERGFAGWCPWQPAPVAVNGTAPAAVAAVPAAPALAVASWLAGCAVASKQFLGRPTSHCTDEGGSSRNSCSRKMHEQICSLIGRFAALWYLS